MTLNNQTTILGKCIKYNDLNNKLKLNWNIGNELHRKIEETAYIVILIELIINKSVKSSLFRMYH